MFLVLFSASNASSAERVEYGWDRGAGNVIAVQTPFDQHDYANAESFSRAAERPLADARAKGWIGSKTLVVYPEMVGLYLLVAEEEAPIYDPKSDRSLTSVVIGRIFSRLSEVWAQPSPIPFWKLHKSLERKYLNLKAPRMAEIYQETFSSLAARYGVTIVAGSTVLPGPSVDPGGALRVDPMGPVQNVLAVFDRSGRMHPRLTVKARPIREEWEIFGMKPASFEDFPAYDTPLGKVGALICADSWYPGSYARMSQLGVDLVVVPVYPSDFAALWKGYSAAPGTDLPTDVDAADIGRLTEGQAWLKYALAGRWKGTAVMAFANGKHWDTRTRTYAPLIMEKGELLTENFVEARPELVSYWLPRRASQPAAGLRARGR